MTLLKALVDSDAIMPEDVPPILLQLLPSPRVPVVALPLLPRLQTLGDDDFASKFRFRSFACLRSLHAALQLQDEFIHPTTRNRFDSLELLAVLLQRFAFPTRLPDLREWTGWSASRRRTP